ncbi:MAG: AAA family ATPase [Gemmatimonadaceae bacterium]|nr:AAA family ATPase [Gemmatimonadaceae bacterium]
MASSLQLTLPFAPSWSWWLVREAQVAMDHVIEYALTCTALAPSWGRWGHPDACVSAVDAAVQLELWSVPGTAPRDPTRPRSDAVSLADLDEDDDRDDRDDRDALDADDTNDEADTAGAATGAVYEARDAWMGIEAIVERLGEAGVTGNPEVVRLLALLASPAYRAHGYGPRFLLTAPPSAGKTFLLGALADALGVPSLHIDASIITPEGWSGTNVSELINARIGRGPGQYSIEQWRAGAVLVLDEIDKACRASPDDRYGTEVRLERQHAMLGLVWGGTPIRLKDGAAIRTDRWVVAACGAFATTRFVAEQRPPTDPELIAWGMSPELASRLPIRLVLAPLTRAAFVERLQHDPRGLTHVRALAATLGVELEVPEQTLAFLAQAAEADPQAFTVRAASGCLSQAVLERLARMGPQQIGQALRLVPDDLTIVVQAPVRRRPPRDGEDEVFAL